MVILILSTTLHYIFSIATGFESNVYRNYMSQICVEGMGPI